MVKDGLKLTMHLVNNKWLYEEMPWLMTDAFVNNFYLSDGIDLLK